MKLMLILLIATSSFAQSDNRYCTKDNKWIGTTVTNPVLRDGSAELPRVCFNTDPVNTPSPGPVVKVIAGQSIQKAYDAATCGTTISLAHGATWNDPFTFTAKNCDDQHWITITTDGTIPPPGVRINPSYVEQMANLNMLSPSGFRAVGDHIRFVGLHFTKGKPQIYFFLPAVLKDSNKIIFDRIYVHCNPAEECQHGITVSTAKYVAVIDSYMDEFHCIAQTGACVDSQAISGGSAAVGSVITSGPVKIVNNFLEASTENILFGGAKADGPGPNDIEIRRNYLFKDQRWNPNDPNFVGVTYIVKNNYEMKNGTHALIEGNVLENSWGGFSQVGFAVLLTPKSQEGANDTNLCPACAVEDITFRYNYIHTAAATMQIGSGVNDHGGYSQGQHRLSVHDNVFDNLQYPGCYKCALNLMQIGSFYSATNIPPEGETLSDVSVNRNTIIAVGTVATGAQESALLLIRGVPPNVATPQVHNVSFQNNIATTQKNGMYSAGGGTDNCTSFAKPQKPVNMWPICFIGSSPFLGNVLIGYPSSMSDWPTGNMFSPSLSTVGFDDPANAVYSLPQDSPYFGKGANIDAVNLATFGVKQ